MNQSRLKKLKEQCLACIKALDRKEPKVIVERDIDLLMMQYGISKEHAIHYLSAAKNVDQACRWADASESIRKATLKEPKFEFDIETVSYKIVPLPPPEKNLADKIVSIETILTVL